MKARSTKGQFVLNILLFLDYTQCYLYPDSVADLCLEECIERDEREWLLCFPVWILQLSPSYVQHKREKKGTMGPCVSAQAKEDLSQVEQIFSKSKFRLKQYSSYCLRME